ncbi:hypothetical protein NE237_021977 [Protea cynaroides]|uniref:NAC domain-containing protein n=1 Tax=Protea cynaroides TaxID=273540 RepID=A0A9Q0HDK0_9MAGN|nr:hypothetical protein NE237_021977 [Protea cynaroides]
MSISPVLYSFVRKGVVFSDRNQIFVRERRWKGRRRRTIGFVEDFFESAMEVIVVNVVMVTFSDAIRLIAIDQNHYQTGLKTERLDEMTTEVANEENLPPGFRFRPTDLELVKAYLSPRVLGDPYPGFPIADIDENELYSKPPNKLEINSCGREKECFFFTQRNRCSHDGLESIRTVGNGNGFWKFEERECINVEDKVASKICWTYYSGTPNKGKRTHWIMFEYQMQLENDQCKNQELEKEWVIGSIKYKWTYKSPFE